MTTVILHGNLRRKFGEKARYSVRNVREVLSALSANKKGFREHVVREMNEGLFYDIIADGEVIHDEHQINHAPKVVHIVPVISGAAIFAGVGALIGAVFSSAVTSVLTGLGKMLLYAVIGGLVQSLFAPKQQKQRGQVSEASAGLSSYYFGGRVNKAQQGQPVPIVYGELKVGSYVVQAGVKSLNKEEFEELSK